jgi:hypothetical protein
MAALTPTTTDLTCPPQKLFELTEGFVEKIETKRSVQQSTSSDDEEENDN